MLLKAVVIMHAISEVMGYELEVVDMEFHKLMAALTNGEVNCIVGGLEETSSEGEGIAFVIYIDDGQQPLLDETNTAIKSLQMDGTIDAIVEYYLDYQTFDKIDKAAS